MTQKDYRKQVSFFKALAHPTRLFIVEQLALEEKCVCELTEMVGVDISTISKHLLSLKNAGIVIENKRGKNVYYSLCCGDVTSILECVASYCKE